MILGSPQCECKCECIHCAAMLITRSVLLWISQNTSDLRSFGVTRSRYIHSFTNISKYSRMSISPQKRSGNDVREIHSTNHGTPIALGVTCVVRDVLTFESLDLVALGLDFANWGRLEERDRRRRWRTRA